MLGTDHEPGIMVLTLNDLYKQMDSSKNNLKFTVKMSYLEVSLAIIFYHSQIMENKKNFIVAAYLVPFNVAFTLRVLERSQRTSSKKCM